MDKTCITMVLDRSGSMNSCRQSTIDAVNKYLAEARGSELATADFELTIFDSLSIDTIRSGELSGAKDIAEGDFIPREMTPLYDAMGRGIDSLDGRAKEGKAILVVVTDGMENHSRKHTHSSISELVRTRQEKGWLIIFLGAGLDSAQQGVGMGINRENVANIGLDQESLSASMEVMAATNRDYARTANMEEARAYSAAPKISASMRKRMGDLTGGASLFGRGAKTPSSPSIGKQGEKSAQDDSWNGPSEDTWRAKN